MKVKTASTRQAYRIPETGVGAAELCDHILACSIISAQTVQSVGQEVVKEDFSATSDGFSLEWGTNFE